MTEFEIVEGKLVMECEHDFNEWYGAIGNVKTRICSKCRELQFLQPVSKEDVSKPSPLPTRSRFSLFLADWKASRRRDR